MCDMRLVQIGTAVAYVNVDRGGNYRVSVCQHLGSRTTCVMRRLRTARGISTLSVCSVCSVLASVDCDGIGRVSYLSVGSAPTVLWSPPELSCA